MAVNASLLTAGNNGGVAALVFTTASVTPSANHLVLLWVESHPTVTPTVTGNGLTWVQVVQVSNGNSRTTAFRAMGASPSTGAITITFAVTSQDTCKWVVIDYSGTDTSGTNGSGAIVQSNSATTVSAVLNQTVTLTSAIGAGNAVAGAFSHNGGTETQTAGSGYTKLGETADAAEGDLAHEWAATGTTTPSMSWTTAVAAWSVAVEIQVASASTSGSSPIRPGQTWKRHFQHRMQRQPDIVIAEGPTVTWLPGLSTPRRSLRKLPTFRTNSGTDVPESLLPPSAIKRATPGRRQYAPVRVDGDTFSPPFVQAAPPTNPAITQTTSGRVRRLAQVLRRASSAPEPIPAQVAPVAPSWVPGLRTVRRLTRNRPRAALGAPLAAQDTAPGMTTRRRPHVSSRRLRGSQSSPVQVAPVPLVARRLRIIARTVRRAGIVTPTRAQVSPPIVQTVFGRLRTAGRVQPRPRVSTPTPAQQAAATNPSITATVFGRLRTVGRIQPRPRIVKPIPAQVNPPIVQTVFARLRTVGRIQPRAKVNEPTPAQQAAVPNPRITQTMFGRLRLSGRTNRIPRIVKPTPGQVNPPYPVKPSRVVAFRGTSRRRAVSTSSPQVQPTAVTRTVPTGGLRGLRRVWLKIRRKNVTPVPGQVTTLQGPLIITDSYGGTEADRNSGTVVGGTYGSTGSSTVSKSSSGGFSADPDNDNVSGTYDSDSDSL